ncbi:MAG: rhomboid family intramembrane serine protease [Bacteroidota bacterium]|nr:rhomboid family intramembrane serine protease [Bacteroidota bacterium]
MEEETINEQPEEKAKNRNPFSALIPRDDYFFTPILLGINILIFVLMVVSGADLMNPGSNALIEWGANKRSLTLGGEPWRLFTCMFLHVGIIHLAVNMLALFSLGRMVEPFIGKWRFLALYLFAGLGGSAVSLWWHADANVPSAGASGAIFGLFGIFAALLTTDLIRKEIRKELLMDMGKAIVLNLLIGLYGRIDNSAHIGGLLTGAAGGYLCYFDLRDWYGLRVQKYRGIIFTGLLTAGAIVFFWMMVPDKLPADNETLVNRMEVNEERAITFWGSIDSTTTADAVHENFTKPWADNLASIDSLNLKEIDNENFKSYLPDFRRYTNWMYEAGKYYERALRENRPDFKDSSAVLMNKAGEEVSKIKLKQSQDK